MYLRTCNRDKAPLEGDAIENARQDSWQTTAKPIVALKWILWVQKNGVSWQIKAIRTPFPLRLYWMVLFIQHLWLNKKLSTNSQITGSFTAQTATDLANILKIGKLDAPAKIVQDQQVGPTLGKKAYRVVQEPSSFPIVIFPPMLVYYNTSDG